MSVKITCCVRERTVAVRELRFLTLSKSDGVKWSATSLTSSHTLSWLLLPSITITLLARDFSRGMTA